MNFDEWPARIGIRPGATVMLMADVKRMAWRCAREGQRFDPMDLLDAFLKAVGPSGTLLVPTFTFHLENGDAFDMRTTGTISGTVGNAALVHPSFQRTPHPLHSFAVAGKDAERLVHSSERDSFGPESPFAYLYSQKGVLVNLDLSVNHGITFAHYVEQQLAVPYRKLKWFRFSYTDRNGSTRNERYALHTKKPGHHMNFSPLDREFEQAGVLLRGVVEGSDWIRIDLHGAYPVIAANLKKGGPDCVHRFRWSWWLRDHVKSVVHAITGRTNKPLNDVVGQAG
jgi:aminoglycoside 3-N-acetyltransferase